ncbi:MAG: putative transporter integral rane protein [Acidimicrobiales bacterium]|jgi:ABC-2 type transport system permease protein|nr:putative transporter integral rane protein [Acidimicrobiales bacterium]
MTHVIRAQLIRLLRRKTMVLAAVGATAFAVMAATTVFSSAKHGGAGLGGRAVTLETLAGKGGGTLAFATAASFIGFFIFVTFIALMASEFSGGTFRALLLRDPRRLRVLVGQVVGILIVIAGIAAVAELLTFALSFLMAASRGVPTSAWLSSGGAGDAIKNYATVLAGVGGWAVLGTTLAVIFRSAPLALGIGFVWAGPFEHLVANAWTTGNQWFPGLVLQSLIAGGTNELALGRALVMGLVYVGVAATATLALVATRDVTA